MRVNWVAYGVVETKNGELHSRFASARYRIILPMAGLVKRGHAVSLVQIGNNSVTDKVVRALDGDIVVFSKLMTPNREQFEQLSRITQTLIDTLHKMGRRIVADLNDNYFEHEFYGAFFRDLVRRVDTVVTSTAEMSELVARFTDCRVAIVTDPFEGPRGAPQFRPPVRRLSGRFARWFWNRHGGRRPLYLAWFGHQSNWKTMRAVVESLLNLRGWIIELEIITSPGFGVEQFCSEFNAKHGGTCRLRFTAWSPAATWEGLARADLVLIPSWPDDVRKAVKSPNRLVECLRAGRFAVVSPLPAYLPMAAYCWLGENMVEGLKWMLDHPEEAQRRVVEGQSFVESTYSPEVIAGEWEAALAQVGNRCA